MDEVGLKRIKKDIREIENLSDDESIMKVFYKVQKTARELVKNHPENAFPVLEELAHSKNNDLLDIALFGLGQLGDNKCIDFLCEIYKNSSNYHVKSKAAISIVSVKNEYSIFKTLALLDEENDEKLIADLQFKLVYAHPKKPELAEKGLKSKRDHTRFVALKNLIEHSPDYLPTERYLEFAKDKDSDTRGEAFKYLLTLNREEDLQLFYDALFDNNWNVASSAYKYLAKNLGSITPEIKKAVKKGGGANFKRAIIQFIKTTKDPQGIPILADFFTNEKTSGRRFNMLVAALKSFKGQPEAVNTIFSLLKNKEFEPDPGTGQIIRYELWNALIYMKAVELIPQIEGYIADKPVDEVHCTYALEELNSL